jgi:hypothetical protein
MAEGCGCGYSDRGLIEGTVAKSGAVVGCGKESEVEGTATEGGVCASRHIESAIQEGRGAPYTTANTLPHGDQSKP